MDVDTTRVAMLYQDPHPAHRGFAEAVDADLVDYRRLSLGPFRDSIIADVLNGLVYPDYDVYLVEGSRPLYAALIHRFTSSSKLVYLCADHGLYSLGNPDFSGDSALKSAIGRYGTPIVRAVARHGIDGVIAVSEFAAGFTQPIVGAGTPIDVAHPYIQPNLFERLGRVTPSPDRNVAVTLGRAARYKGVDMLVEAWPAVRERHPDAKLHVVGSGHPAEYGVTDGVRVHGFIEDVGSVFERSALFVQPSRMDTFPVSTLEAMRAGVVPLVTATTGTRSVARALSDRLVVDPSPDALAMGVAAFFDRPAAERRSLSERARERGSTFDGERRKRAFKGTFDRVLDAL